MSHNGQSRDPEDMFADTRMTFGEHIEELRGHLWKAIAGFLIAMFASLFLAQPVLSHIIIEPVEEQLQAFYVKRNTEYRKKIAEKIKNLSDSPANQPIQTKVKVHGRQLQAIMRGEKPEPVGTLQIDDPDLVDLDLLDPNPLVSALAWAIPNKYLEPPPSVRTFGATEAFMVYFKIAIVCGLVFGSPWIFYQIWMFIAAGLYPHEKKLVNYYLPISLGLFLAGAVFCQFIVLPKAIQALLWFNELINVEPDIRLNEYLGFAILLPLIFGLSFQTPLVMLFLERVGLVSVETFRTKRKIAFFVLAVISAVGPTIDYASMLFQLAALYVLYELGILLCAWSSKRQELDIEVPESEQMVEV
jgi:sec-independent protein translocase protein TatC